MSLNFFSIFAAVEGLLPVINAVVTEVESMAGEISGPAATGASKLSAATTLVNTIYTATNPSVPFATIEADIKSLISAVVSVKNTFGIFKTSLSAPVAQ